MSNRTPSCEPLRFLPRTENLEHVRTYVRSAIVSTFLTAVERNGVVLAVDEACANLIAHAADLHEAREIEVAIEITPVDIAIEIRDQSASFDPRGVAQPNMADYFREMRTGGLGIALIKRVMDQIEYIPASADAPVNRLIMHKRHRSAS